MTRSRLEALVCAIAIAGLAIAAPGCGLAPRRDTAGRGVAGGGRAARAASESVYQLDLAFVDQDGRGVHLRDLRGETVLAAMMYTSCQSACPRLIADLQGIERVIPRGERERTRLVLVSLDPARDSPAALRAFARAHALDPSRWTLLTASEDEVRQLAMVLGVRYRAEANGEILHSSTIVLIDKDGVIRHRQVGLGQDPGPLLAALEASAAPSASR